MISRILNHNDLSESMQLLKNLGAALCKRGYIIAGGSIFCAFHKLPINDIDILSTHKGIPCNIGIFMECLSEAGFTCVNPESLVPHESLYAINHNVDINGKVYKIQFIKAEGKATGTVYDILSNFDIQNVSVYINHNGNPATAAMRNVDTKFEENGAIHLLSRKDLHLGAVISTSGTLERIIKYQNRGLQVNWPIIIEQLNTIAEAKSKMRMLKNILTPAPRATQIAKSAFDAFFTQPTNNVRSAGEEYENFVGLTSIGFTPYGADTIVASVNTLIRDLIAKDISKSPQLLSRIEGIYTRFGGEIEVKL